MEKGGDPLHRLAPICFEAAELNDLRADERREWWLANGTRRLCRRHGRAKPDAALPRAADRADRSAARPRAGPDQGGRDAAIVGTERYPLFTNRWGGGAVDPEGYKLARELPSRRHDPVWRFRCGEAVVEHRIWMEQGADTVYLAWRLESDVADAALAVTFLANGRDHHGDTWEAGFNPDIAADGVDLTVTVPGRFALRIAGTGGEIDAAPRLVRQFRPAGRARARSQRPRLASACRRWSLAASSPGFGPGYAASLDPDRCRPISTPRSPGAAPRTGRCWSEAIAADPHLRGGAGLGPAAGACRRPLPHRPAAARRAGGAVGHRRLSVVRRLGPRHDDLAAGTVPRGRAF